MARKSNADRLIDELIEALRYSRRVHQQIADEYEEDTTEHLQAMRAIDHIDTVLRDKT